MNQDDTGGFGTLIEPATYRIQRRLPGPIERVWAYLTDSELRARWLAAGEMDLRAGASVELVWRNDDLSDSTEGRPEGFPEVVRMDCPITRVEPPHYLSFLWQGGGEVQFRLEVEGDGVLLTVTHHRLVEHGTRVMVGAGWHMHLDLLVVCLRGQPRPSFWRGWARLHEAYAQRMTAEAEARRDAGADRLSAAAG
ncbi:MAG: SRPBCC family protein [Rhodocyclaceae bacterium]|nr:SRPBCC family protein [Rhodocyclaceae bacterium]